MFKLLDCSNCGRLSPKCSRPITIDDLVCIRRCEREIFDQEQAAASMSRYHESHPIANVKIR
jgi:hypothetical protein